MLIMMLSDMLSFSINTNAVWYFIIVITVVRYFYRYYTHPLSQFRGPVLASYTELWGVWNAWRKSDPLWIVDLHKRYGDVVRLAPNVLSFSQPEAIKEIYLSGFHKAKFYSVSAGVSNGVVVANLFSSIDETYHNRLRRAVNSAFAMTSTLQYEPKVTKNLDQFLEHIDRRFSGTMGAEGVLDLPQWMMFFAVDGIGELTNNASYGLMDAGRDVPGIYAAMLRAQSYFKVVCKVSSTILGLTVYWIGPMPSLDGLFWKNPVLILLEKYGWVKFPRPTVPFAVNALEQRQQLAEKPESDDLLAKFLNAKRDHPDVVGDKDVLGMSLSMVNAGSDTTAITLSAIFYFLLKNPLCLQKLERELEANLPARDPSSFKALISFYDAQKLPYLEACINEAFRLHPAFGPIQPRVIPPAGARICGHRLEGGTVVGCSAWALHRKRDIFGDDVEVYRPERWLDPQKATLMNRAMFHFGGGAHTCIGKNISLLEIYKLVPSFLRTFKVTLVNPEKEWVVHSRVFVQVSGFDVRIERRH